MQHIFWLRESLIAGRPGPDKEPWIPQQLVDTGIGAVLSVNDARLVHVDDLTEAGLDYRCIPLSPNAPPREGDLEHCLKALPLALDYLLVSIENKRIPMIHCTSGKDRTGLLMCYYLCRCEGYSPQNAIDEVKQIRPIALTATDYEPFAKKVLIQLAHLN